MGRIPEKLKSDAILEALLEVRFSHDEIPEILLGRLADLPAWKAFKMRRLPISEIPEFVRANDASLRFQPLIERVSRDGRFNAKIGYNVVSFHNMRPYLGWDTGLSEKIKEIIEGVFSSANSIKVNRLGLRYVNALTSNEHFISSPNDIEISVEIGGSRVEPPFNINFRNENSPVHDILYRIATHGFVQGTLPAGTAVYVDIDVSTKNDFVSVSPEEVLSWIQQAHLAEKEAFFSLIPEEIIKKLEDVS